MIITRQVSSKLWAVQSGHKIYLNAHFLEKLWLLIYEKFGQNPEHSISIWRGLAKEIYLDLSNSTEKTK